MQIFGPRGLKIRLEADYSFALMARLFPKVKAFKILQTTESLEVLPAAITFIATIIAFVLSGDIYTIAITTFLAYFITYLTTLNGFIIPGLLNIGKLYGYLSMTGTAYIIIALTGYMLCGINGILGFIIGRAAAGISCYIIDLFTAKSAYKKKGILIWSSERNFLNAYRLYADKIGVTNNLDIKDQELEQENWEDCFEDLAISYPKIVSRFR